jgi:predicted O-methyltransferase YrrM
MTNPMIRFLAGNEPYFGGQTQGVQGNAIRHPFMAAAICLLGQTRPRVRLLEVGSYAGFSALTWAEAIETFCPQGGEMLCVDPWLGYYDEKVLPVAESKGTSQEGLVAMSDDQHMDYVYDLFRHNISFVNPKKVAVRHIRGSGVEIFPYLKERQFDLVYIEGRHLYEDVLADLRGAAPLVAPGGLLCGDDLEAQLGEVDAAVERANAGRHSLNDPKTGVLYHPGVTLAVAEFFGGQVANHQGFWAMRRSEDGSSYAPADLSQSAIIIPKHFPQVWRDALQSAMASFRKTWPDGGVVPLRGRHAPDHIAHVIGDQ